MAKTVNYTPEQTVALVTAYEAAESDEARKSVIAEFADSLGKSVASVRQKLVRENVYQKKEYTTKNGGKAESKAAIVEGIAKSLGVASEQAESLEKANKVILQKIREALAE